MAECMVCRAPTNPTFCTLWSLLIYLHGQTSSRLPVHRCMQSRAQHTWPQMPFLLQCTGADTWCRRTSPPSRLTPMPAHSTAVHIRAPKGSKRQKASCIAACACAWLVTRKFICIIHMIFYCKRYLQHIPSEATTLPTCDRSMLPEHLGYWALTSELCNAC
jgi:hypothetical protein